MNKLFLFLLIAVMSVGCAATSNQNLANKDQNGEMQLDKSEVSPESQLESYLRRTPGVTIQGSGRNASVQIRGVNSFSGNTEPLFVLNGSDIGNSYANAANLIRGMEIKSVRVLKNSDASLYGVRGAGGVILITAK